jgi:hypothetical protein
MESTPERILPMTDRAQECADAFSPFNVPVPEAPINPPPEYETPAQEDFSRAKECLRAAIRKARLDMSLADTSWEAHGDLEPGAMCSDLLEDLLILADAMLREGVVASGRAVHVAAKIQQQMGK